MPACGAALSFAMTAIIQRKWGSHEDCPTEMMIDNSSFNRDDEVVPNGRRFHSDDQDRKSVV